MMCSNCGGRRVALVALPGIGPIDLHVCLACGASWGLSDAASDASGAVREPP